MTDPYLQNRQANPKWAQRKIFQNKLFDIVLFKNHIYTIFRGPTVKEINSIYW